MLDRARALIDDYRHRKRLRHWAGGGDKAQNCRCLSCENCGVGRTKCGVALIR